MALPSSEVAQDLGDMPYVYEPLGAAEKAIRLLLLEPGLRDDTIQCTLLRADLDEIPAPKYETISYCWGDATLRAEILVDGCVFDAPASSVAALRRTRLEDRCRTLWIDAICIDQNNVNERNCQVPLMKDIYSRSEGNLIYLGEPDGSEADAMAGLDLLLEEAAAETRGFAAFASRLAEPIDSSEPNEDLATKFDSLVALFSRPWFSRLWVVQEAVLAPSNLCLLGNHEIPLLPLCASATWMYHEYLNVLASPSVVFRLYAVRNLLEMADRTGEIIRPPSVNFFRMGELLIFQRHLMVTNPRDRVYGVLGMFMAFEKHPASSQIIVDYDKPLNIVLEDATRIVLDEQSSAIDDEVLQRVSHRDTAELDDTWPSWVPRWDRPWDGDQDPVPLYGHLNNSSGGMQLQLEPIRRSESQSTGLLTTQGVCIAQVENCSLPLNPDILYDAKRFLSWLEGAQSTTSRSSDEIGISLVGGRTRNGTRASPTYGANLQVLVNYLREHGDTPRKGSGDAQVEQLYQYYTVLHVGSKKRRFFVSTTGQIGVGPKVLEKGDIVTVIYGSHLPCILRRYGEQYKFIGVCYVQGIMDGEAVHEHRASGKPDETFTLC